MKLYASIFVFICIVFFAEGTQVFHYQLIGWSNPGGMLFNGSACTFHGPGRCWGPIKVCVEPASSGSSSVSCGYDQWIETEYVENYANFYPGQYYGNFSVEHACMRGVRVKAVQCGVGEKQPYTDTFVQNMHQFEFDQNIDINHPKDSSICGDRTATEPAQLVFTYWWDGDGTTLPGQSSCPSQQKKEMMKNLLGMNKIEAAQLID